MRDVRGYYEKISEIASDVTFRSRTLNKAKSVLLSIFKLIIIVGMSYIILGPVINIVSNSFFSPSDVYNPSVFMIPLSPTLENFKRAFTRLNYWSTLGYTMVYIVSITLIQILICSMVGYGFARFEFPLKKLLFGCVIVTIVLPAHVIMLPIYQHFRMWDIFGIIQAVTGKTVNLLSQQTPMYLMTLFGTGLRSGLYIYIFRQFFRGLPKEIEEAALIDGAGIWHTYFRIMLRNAMPAAISVAVFSMVWQYNDMFYARLFSMPTSKNLTFRLSTIQATIEFVDQIKDPMISQLAVYAGITLVLLPILIIYFVLQKYFVEGIERSGIVG
ncbi:MAG: carbohydrate ABC transporter permease [Clostridiaceae bacterium]|nr:carbohydrate ABC transporter permease [Clostridiaceae bacterium]